MNHLHVRIAVSEAAAWTARRFYGGRYRIVPNGVHLGAAGEVDPETEQLDAPQPDGPLRILFIGQAVERKGLPVLLRAFEALREQVPATLTLVGADADEVAHMMLDDHGVQALGKVSEARKRAELAGADVLCAPSLHGESFGMVLTEALAARTPVVASDIPGYRDVVRDGIEGTLTRPGDALALAEALRSLALDPAALTRMAADARVRAERFAWSHVAAEVLDCYEQARPWDDRRRAPAVSGCASASSPPIFCHASPPSACQAWRSPPVWARLSPGRRTDREVIRANAPSARCVAARWWRPASAASRSRCSRSCTSASVAWPRAWSHRVRACSPPASA